MGLKVCNLRENALLQDNLHRRRFCVTMIPIDGFLESNSAVKLAVIVASSDGLSNMGQNRKLENNNVLHVLNPVWRGHLFK